MASWRQRCEWWREFRYLGARDVQKRVEHVTWAQEKLREAERFLWWRANWHIVLGALLTAIGLLIAFYHSR
jgi:hypothetical protein